MLLVELGGIYKKSSGTCGEQGRPDLTPGGESIRCPEKSHPHGLSGGIVGTLNRFLLASG